MVRAPRFDVLKICTKCKLAKAGTEFNVSQGTRDGLAFRCKECQRADYASADRSRLKAVRAEWYARNKAGLKPTRTAYHLAHKAEAQAQGAAWRRKNEAKLKAQRKEYHRRNRDRLRAYYAALWQKNKASMTVRNRAWAKANPQKVAVLMQRRRARVAAALATLTAAQWEAILELHGNACAYCGKPGKMTMDHVLPVSRGGGTTADNVVPACQSCNSSKGAKTPEEWRN
jgi:5-methylcytosine-specific restriction endonuclease McrA